MVRDPRYDALFEPVRIGPKTMRNRFCKVPHCTSFGSDWPGTQAHFRAMAAEGGWALINTEYCSIHPSSDDHGHGVGARIWDDSDVRNLGLMCEKIHEHDSLAGIELWYGAAHAPNYESRMPARGVSQIPSDFAPMQSCYAIDRAGIRELQRFYVEAAIRARRAGFDVINVYGGHGHPITYQFLDPYYNKRQDEYGGSFQNRARFWHETIQLVREAVGDDCAIAARICLESLREGGMNIADAIAFVELADDLVDLWDLQLGGIISEWGEDTLASRFATENYQRPWLEKVRPHTDKPIVGVGRFTNPDTMVEMVRTKVIDAIGSARGSIADPFLPNKIAAGQLDEIRECIGCNICAARYNQHALLICTQNATAGEEYRRGWHPEKFTRAANADSDVLIVGAGPAGMECAVVLAKRGMRRIHLIDAAEDIGGIMRWVPTLPGLGEWARVVNYRRIQLHKLRRQVEVITGVRLDEQAVLEYGADIVIVATGARWATDGLNGATHSTIPGADAALAHVLTPEQVMVGGKAVPDGPVLVYDCDGYFMGIGMAEKLAREGRSVTLVTPQSVASPYSFFTLEGPRVNKMLRDIGVSVVPDHLITSVAPGRVCGANVYTPDRPVEWDAAAVILVTQRVSDDVLYHDLKANSEALEREGISSLHRIGDCVVPRLIADAVFDGHRLAREIDTDDPATPLPFIRENRHIGASDADYDSVLSRNGAAYVPNSVAVHRHAGQ